MTKDEYLLHVIENRYYAKRKWYFYFFGIPNLEQDNEYLKIENNVYKVKVKDDWVELETGVNYNKSIYLMKDPITIDKLYAKNVKSKITTTVGRLLANVVLLVEPFGDKLEFMDKQFTPSDVEKLIGPRLRSGEITVEEYLKFTDCVSLLTGISRLINISATERNTVPPPSLEKEKTRIAKKLESEYGKDWDKDPVVVNKFKDELRAYDKEWLKDDPSYGKLLNKKITDNCRTMQYLTVGIDPGFNKDSKGVNVYNSLNDGYPKNKEQLTSMFNASRAASFDRGHETQKGGAAAKDLLRSTSNITIINNDCGSKKGLEILVTKDNAKFLNSRYFVNGSKINNAENMIGKTITIRSPMYCLAKNGKICSVCAGDILASAPNSVSLNLLKLSAFFLSTSLKATHNSQTTNIEYDILEEIK